MLVSLRPWDEARLPGGSQGCGSLLREGAEGAAKGSLDEAVAALAKYTGAKVPKRQLEELVVRAAQDPGDVIDEAFLDALSRDPGRERKWVVLVDGNKDHIKHVRAAARRHGVEVTIVIDVIHVLEYLWAAAPVFHEEGTPELEAWVTERLLWLLCGEAGQVAAAIRRSATKRGLCPEQRKAADRCELHHGLQAVPAV